MRGFLLPEQGVIKSYATQGGTIAKLFVNDGDTVEKGQPLAKIVVQTNNSQGQVIGEQLADELTTQTSLLGDEIAQNNQLKAKELSNLSARYQQATNELAALQQQLTLANKKRAIIELQYKKLSVLSEKGHISSLEKERQYQSLLDNQQAEQELKRLLMQQQNSLTQLSYEQQRLPQQYQLTINNLKRQQAELNRQLTQLKSQNQYTVVAQNSGTVTSINVVEGETLRSNKPLLHILPENTQLVAELLLPTRSAGFVRTGDVARLRFDAFPYQRFGALDSHISRVDLAVANPNELNTPVSTNEPVYRQR